MKIIFSMHEELCESAALPKTLCDWVKNFRLKKMQMKRKLRAGGDLRVCAIMATALMSAENKLRMKQQERLNRCIQLQSKFHGALIDSKITATPRPALNSKTMQTTATPISKMECEQENDDKQPESRKIEICNLWREELNGLDEFMRKMSNSCNSGDNSFDSCSESAFQNSSDVTALRQHIAVSS